MSKRVEEFIPKAIKAVDEAKIAASGIVSSQYNGYISSFGASIGQTGLLPTVAFFSNEQSSAEKDRKKLLDAINIVLQTGDKELMDFLLKDSNYKKSHIKKDVLDAAVALKLAIRTFKLEKENQE